MVRMKWAAVLFAAALAVPGVAHASGDWPWPVSGHVALGYGQTYTDAQGKTCTHGGMDIEAASGGSVRASASGQVTFAGLVPAGAGNQAYAVTVLTADGLRVTYLPLRSVAVHKGENVSEGDSVGALAETGDASSSAAHLHMGVRRGDTALDPLTFLAASASSPAPVAPTAPGTAAGKTSSPGLPVAKAAPSGASAAAHAPVTSPQQSQAPVTAGSGASSAVRTPAHNALRDAGRSASGALAKTPALSRVSQVAGTPQLKFQQMFEDMAAGRGLLTSWAVRLGLLVVAGACVIPVWKSVKAAGERAALAAAEPAPMAVGDNDRP